jgi:hypothetical protein
MPDPPPQFKKNRIGWFVRPNAHVGIPAALSRRPIPLSAGFAAFAPMEQAKRTKAERVPDISCD